MPNPKPTTTVTLCLAEYGDRLASVFDNATALGLYEHDGCQVQTAGRVPMARTAPLARVQSLLAMGVDVLICGALSRPMRQLLMESGITVHDWICGGRREVLEAWRQGTLDNMVMPGASTSGEDDLGG